MKRITDGMDAEAKNFEGLKGAKKLFAKVKAGSGIREKDKLQRLAWLMLFRAVLHQEALAQELIEPLLTEICR
jgi:hypothetical protein